MNTKLDGSFSYHSVGFARADGGITSLEEVEGNVFGFGESNTRSATIIGAITGGGIGLPLPQAIITHKGLGEVSYYVLLVIITVVATDWFSAWLRRRPIKRR